MTCKNGRFNTGNKLCSNDLRDTNDNAIVLDGYINSSEKEIEDRFGTPRLTLSGIESEFKKTINNITGDARVSTYINVDSKETLDKLNKEILYDGQRATVSDGVEYVYNSIESLWYPVSRGRYHNQGDKNGESQIDLANFPDVPRRMIVGHHYNDREMIVLDNVGENNVFIALNNARNPVRRWDKPSDFTGNADFLRFRNLIKRNEDEFQGVNVFELKFNGDLEWGHKGYTNKPVSFINKQITKEGFSFELKSTYRRDKLLSIESETGKNALEVENINSLKTIVTSGESFASGIELGSKKGPAIIVAENGDGVVILKGSGFAVQKNGVGGDLPRLINIHDAPRPNSEGSRGDIIYSGGYMYICIAKNLWRRTKMEENW